MSPVRPLAARPWTVYPVDAVLAVALLVGGAVLIASGPALIMTLLGSVLCLLGAGIAYAANGTAIWLSSAHTAQHSTDLAGARTSLRHRRNVGRALPCPYPDAWYAVALSAELPPGGILDAVVCGRSLVIFRPARGGLPSVLDAYCSHNGAHLAHGGSRLVGDCIRCPFHGWCFDAQGRAVSTGVGDRPPPGSDLRAWPVLERNGVVSVWMAAAGHAVPASPTKPAEVAAPAPPKAPAAASLDPWWEPPVFPELNGGGGYVYHGCSEHLVPALIYELPENGADVVHLTELHTDFVVKSLRSLLCHKWVGEWRPDEAHPHIANLHIVESVGVCGGRATLPGPVRVHVTQCGISQVALSFMLPGIGRLFIIETVTPVAPALQRVLHAVYAQPHIPRLVAKAILASTIRAYEQDVPVWAHKRYEPAPRLTAREASVKVYREWSRQFYNRTPGAISFEDAQRAQLRLELGLPDAGSAAAALEW